MNFKYETERKTGTKKGLLELGVTPIYGLLGAYFPGPPRVDEADALGNYRIPPWLRVAPTVTFGAEIGKTIDVGSSVETKDTVIRLKSILRLDAELFAVSRFLGTRSANAYFEGTYWHLPREDGQKNFRLGKAGLSFGLTP